MDSTIINSERSELNKTPGMNGVYMFLQSGVPLYIGKSINIRARLISHFENAKVDPKEHAYVTQSDKIKYILTDTEFLALILEARYIREKMPKYNVRWRDDKSYLYIKLTKNDSYPKLSVTRREENSNNIYYGPFPSVRIASNILKEIRRIIPYCAQKKLSKSKCFYAKIGLCNPCPNWIESDSVSDKKRYRLEYRKNIRNIQNILSGRSQKVIENIKKSIKIETDKEEFEQAIQLRNRLIKLENLVLYKSFDRDDLTEYNVSEKGIKALYELLKPHFVDLKPLSRIECFDMSTFSFKNSTASMVVYTDGLSDKKEYKRFKIKDKRAESDFEMMREVVVRRLNNDWPQPDLIVLDGGKPQVRTVQKVFAEKNIHIPFIGLAKHPDRIVLSTTNYPSLRPPVDNLGYRLLQSIRDESHRFAKKYHILLRTKSML